MDSSTEYWLSAIRGLLGFVFAIQLIVIAYLIQTGLQGFIESVGSIPATFLPILNALQITVILAVASAILLVIGFIVRVMARMAERSEPSSHRKSRLRLHRERAISSGIRGTPRT